MANVRMGLTLEQVEARISASSEEAKRAALAGDEVLTERTLLRKITLEFMRDTMKQDVEELTSSEAKRTADARTYVAASLEVERRVRAFKEEIFTIKKNLGPEGPYAEITMLQEVEARVARGKGLSDLSGGPYLITQKDSAAIARLKELRVSYKQEWDRLVNLQEGFRDSGLLLSPAPGMAEQRVEELKQEIAETELRLGPHGPYAEIPRLEAIEQSVASDDKFRDQVGQPRAISSGTKALIDRLEELRPLYEEEVKRLASLRAALRDAKLFSLPASLSSR